MNPHPDHGDDHILSPELLSWFCSLLHTFTAQRDQRVLLCCIHSLHNKIIMLIKPHEIDYGYGAGVILGHIPDEAHCSVPGGAGRIGSLPDPSGV